MAKKIGSLFVEFSATVDKFMAAFNKAEKGMARVGRRWTTIGQQMSVGISLPLAAIGKASISAAADFESAMNKVSANGDIFGADLTTLQEKALELGKSTQFSATQAADGMANLAAAGFDTNKIVAAMPGILDLAAAGQLSVAKAAEITTNTMGQFNMKAEEAGRIADVLASGAAASNTSVEMIAEAMKYAGTTAGLTGQSFVDLTAAVALLSQQSINAGDAGTDLAAGMANLLKPTKQMKDALAKLGLSVSDLQTAGGKLIPLNQIIEKLNKAGIKGAEVFTLFGKENAKSWAAMLNAGAPALEQMSALIDKDAGKAQKMAAILRQGLKGGFEQMTGAIETAAIQLGLALEPALLRAMKAIEGLANWASSLAKSFSELSPTTQNVAIGIVAFVAAAGPLLAILGPIVTGFSLLIGGVKLFAGAILAAATPVGAFIVAAAALSVLAYEIYQNWEPIKAFFKEKILGPEFFAGLDVIAKAWKDFWNEFQNGANIIKDFSNQIGQSIVDFVDKSIEYLDKLSTKIKDGLIGEFGRTVDQLKGLTDDAAGFFYDMYDKVVGHSYVPDMVRKIQQHVDKLGGEAMYTPIKQATGKSAEEFVAFEKKATKSLDNVQKKAAESARELSNAFGEIGQAFGMDSQSSNMLGDFMGSILSGTRTGDSGGGLLAGLLGSLVGDSSESGLSDIAKSLGETFGFDFGFSAGKDASKAIGQNMDGSLIFPEGTDSALSGMTSDIAGYASLVGGVLDDFKKLKGNAKEVTEGVSHGIGTAIGSYFGGPEGGKLGGQIGNWVGKAIGMTFGGTNKETLARHNIEMFLEDVLSKINLKVPDGVGGLKDLKNIIFGKASRFDDGTWADQFKAMGDQAFNVFNGLGIGLQKVLGITEDVGGQVGYILAQNLNGNIDAARQLFQGLGIDVSQFEDALVQAGENGSMSWHEVEVAMQGIHEAAKPGLVAVGAYNDAFQRLIDTGGRGKEAITELKNVAVEAKEAGIKTLDQLKAKMMADARFTPEQINALFQALSQRGVTSLDQLADASSRTGGGIVADMESLGVAFADVTAQIDKVTEAINKTPDNTEKNIHYNFTSSFDDNTQAAKDGGLFDGAGINSPSNTSPREPSTAALSTRAATTPRVLAATIAPRKLSRQVDTGGQAGNNVNVYVNAPNSTHGSETRIRQVVMSMKDNIVRDAARFVEDRHRRSAR